MRTALLVLIAALALLPAPRAWSQFSSPSAALPATSIPTARQIQPEELVHLLKSSRNAPAIYQVGSRIFFAEAHIPGAQYAGPGSQPSGLESLETAVSKLPKNTFIVLYCGCCPWNRCPNVGPAFKRLHDLGYSNVKVLYLANNFGDDWVKKGYPTEQQ